ncbi:hypothetical protein Lal_00001766 [Lupinus albus]|nr:hypothetical protein Lal_00001766 [Lupinus albus]
MKVATLNVRGLGGVVKKKAVRSLVRSKQIDFLCIQETKLENIDSTLCSKLWVDSDFDWDFLPSIGKSGRILSMWRKEKFQNYTLKVASVTLASLVIPLSLQRYVIWSTSTFLNIWVLRSILKLFELSSGLKINFSKSILCGLNIDGDNLSRLADFLHCRTSPLSFSYLGIPNLMHTWIRAILTGSGLVWLVVWEMDLLLAFGMTTGPGMKFSQLASVDFLTFTFIPTTSLVILVNGWMVNGSGTWLGDVVSLLGKLSCMVNKSDSWEWRRDKSKQYSVKSAYKLLAHHVQQQSLPSQHLLFLWRSKAPLKVTTFAWRLLQDKIPSKEALSRRGVSFPMGDGLSCPFCNDHPESSAHIFSSCFFTYTVWQLFYNWLNISVALHKSPIHNFIYHMGMVKDKKRWSLWSVLWLATIWAIWLSRNDIIFNASKPYHIFESARVKVWLWIKSQQWEEHITYNDWISNLFTCLKIIL